MIYETTCSLMTTRAKQIFFLILTALSLTPWISSGTALLTGVAFGIILGNPFLQHTSRHTPKILKLSVVGLGAGMNLIQVGQVGMQGVGLTALGILLTVFVGLLLGNQRLSRYQHQDQ